MTTELSKQDRGDFNVLKAVIRKHKDSVFEVARALKQIRDRKLWRGQHESYEDFCREEYGFSHQWANKLISPPKLPDEKPPNGTENDENAPKQAQNRPALTGNAVAGEVDGVSSTESDEPPSLDPLPSLEFRARFDALMQTTSNLKRDVRKIAGEAGGELLKTEVNVLERALDEVRATIKFTRPFIACIYCDGRNDNCQACKGLGWLNHAKYDQAPETMKA